MKPTKKLIQETKALIRLSLFLKEVGLKEEFTAKQLREILKKIAGL